MSSEKWRIFGSAEKRPICLDFGGGEKIKAGFAGEAAPRCEVVVPRTLRRLRLGTDPASAATAVVELEDALAALLRRIFYEELLVKPKEHRVVVGEAWDTPHHFRNALARVLFSIFAAPSLYAESCCVLALHAVGVRSGIVIDVSRDETRVLPVAHGVPLHFAASAVPIGARAVEVEMKSLLSQKWRDIGLTDAMLEDHANAIITAVCRVQAGGANTSCDTAGEDAAAVVYRCAGRDVCINAETRVMPCEVLFGYKNSIGLQEGSGEEGRGGAVEHSLMTAIMASLARLNIDSRLVVENIVLSGGLACVPGFSRRVQEELASLASKPNRKKGIGSLQCLVRARIIRLPFSPRIVTWCGASVVGSVDNLGGLSLSQQHWREQGMRLLDRSALA